MTGVVPDELVEPECPAMLVHVWRWFLDLSTTRGSTGFGPAPLGYRDIAAWSALMRTSPTPFEVALLRELDRLFFAECVAEPGKGARHDAGSALQLGRPVRTGPA